jgi:hypothetical protein
MLSNEMLASSMVDVEYVVAKSNLNRSHRCKSASDSNINKYSGIKTEYKLVIAITDVVIELDVEVIVEVDARVGDMGTKISLDVNDIHDVVVGSVEDELQSVDIVVDVLLACTTIVVNEEERETSNEYICNGGQKSQSSVGNLTTSSEETATNHANYIDRGASSLSDSRPLFTPS